MSSLSEDSFPGFLSHLLKPSTETSKRPRVTLTFAQSLDARIAGAAGKQLILSGPESMVMTHWLRTLHDAILVGIGTALNDNPQLNTRHLPPSSTSRNVPRPIILDSQLRCLPDCKLLSNYQSGVGRRPWIFASEHSRATSLSRATALEKAGARIFYISGEKNNLTISNLLTTLAEHGVGSLMVEGGAQVIKSFFNAHDVVDNLIVTVAPILVGHEGISYEYQGLRNFEHLSTNTLGKDTVICMTAPTAN